MKTITRTLKTVVGTPTVLGVEIGKNPAGEMQYQSLAVDPDGNLCHLPDDTGLPDPRWRWATAGDVKAKEAAAAPPAPAAEEK